MCLVRGRSFGSLASSKAPELSSNTLQYTFGSVQMVLNLRTLNSSSKYIMGIVSCREVDKAMYSASVVDKATCDCSLDAQIIVHAA